MCFSTFLVIFCLSGINIGAEISKSLLLVLPEFEGLRLDLPICLKLKRKLHPVGKLSS
jgi:hypothetical protein